MKLPVQRPIKPMLAKRVDRLPEGEGWLFEPKWDGFRALVFRDGDQWALQSRDCKPLERYFPELGHALTSQLPARCALDGEVVIATAGGLDFSALQMRLHPAASRVSMLAETVPASLVIWDLLCVGDEDLTSVPFAERRGRLEEILSGCEAPIHLTPATRDRALATDWFSRFEGAGLDGVMAKRLDGTYEPNKRAMLKVKHQRTADCVVAGFRWHKDGEGEAVGSLLLGLYDAESVLHHVGVAASFSAARRLELAAELEPYREGAEAIHPWRGWTEPTGKQRKPGAQSRWSRDKDLSFVMLRPELVAEVSYDHMQGDRFRHTTHFVRWRHDKPVSDCNYEQLEVAAPYELERIFGRPGG